MKREKCLCQCVPKSLDETPPTVKTKSQVSLQKKLEILLLQVSFTMPKDGTSPAGASKPAHKSSSPKVNKKLPPTPTGTSSHLHAQDNTIRLSHREYLDGCWVSVARTYFVNPSTVQEQEYRAVLRAMEAAMSGLKPGSHMTRPRNNAVKALKDAGQVNWAAHVLCSGLSIRFQRQQNFARSQHMSCV